MKRINHIEPWVGEEEKQELIETIESGWITEAAKTRQFEEMVAEYVGSKYGLAVNNGTVSLVIAVLALGIGKGEGFQLLMRSQDCPLAFMQGNTYRQLVIG